MDQNIYQQGGRRRRSTRRSTRKLSRKSSRKSSRRRSSRKQKRSLPPALVEYRKLSDKVLKAIMGLSGLPDHIKDGAPMKKLIGKLLRENNRDVDKIVRGLTTSNVVRDYDRAKREMESNRKEKKQSRSSTDY